MIQEKEKTHKDLHREAMEIGHRADKLKTTNKAEAVKLYKEAYEKECEAAMILEEEVNCEPTRSVLFRSAGWFAFHAGMFKDAHDMAVRGKRFCMHEELKEELEELFVISQNPPTPTRHKTQTQVAENPLLNLLQFLPIGCKLEFDIEYFNQVSITLTDKDSGKSAKTVLPMDHHLKMERMNSVMSHLENKIKE